MGTIPGESDFLSTFWARSSLKRPVGLQDRLLYVIGGDAARCGTVKKNSCVIDSREMP